MSEKKAAPAGTAPKADQPGIGYLIRPSSPEDLETLVACLASDTVATTREELNAANAAVAAAVERSELVRAEHEHDRETLRMLMGNTYGPGGLAVMLRERAPWLFEGGDDGQS